MTAAEDISLDSIEDVRRAMGLREPVWWCPRACSLLLSHRTRPGAKMACRSFCKTWDCPNCRAMNVDKHGLNLAGRVLSHGEAVYAVRVAKESAFKRRQQRAKAKWARLVTTCGTVYLTTDPTGERAEELDTGAAVVRLGEWLRSLDYGSRRKGVRLVTTCRAWALPDAASEYTCDGVIRQADAEPVAEFFRAHGIPFQRCGAVSHAWALAFTLPADPTAELVDGLKAVLLPARRREPAVSPSATREHRLSLRAETTRREVIPTGPRSSRKALSRDIAPR